jgi:hypothetical protein
MSQKIKVQDGNIQYSGVPSDTNPLGEIDFAVNGQINVSNEIVVGSVNSPIDGVVSTGNGTALERARLDVTTGTYGDLSIYQSPTDGKLFLNNAQWPSGAEVLQPGTFIGATDVNKLEYLSFALGIQDDSWTVPMLNATYPTASAGQFVVGTTVLYMCVSTGQWRILGGATPPPPPSGSPQEFVCILANPFNMIADGSTDAAWNATVLQESTECTVNDFGTEADAVFTLTTAGIYKVTVTGRIRSQSYPEGPLTIQSMFYGTQVLGANTEFNMSTHQCGDAFDGWPNNGFQNQIEWTDTFYIENYFGDATFTIGIFANELLATFGYNSVCMVSVVRTNGSVWPNMPF